MSTLRGVLFAAGLISLAIGIVLRVPVLALAGVGITLGAIFVQGF